MVKEIIKYPTTPSIEFGTDVRSFNSELMELIQDLKDTIDENQLNALAAFQIGSPFNVIVIKNNNEYIELINARIIKKEGSVEPIETTAYFPGISAKTKRYDKIKVMYEDRDAKQQFLDADGELSIIIQRKLDYSFGSNFRVRLDENELKLLDSKLEFGTDSITQNDCPTVFKRDRILQVIKYTFAVSLVGVVSSFFLSDENILILKQLENFSMIFMLSLLIIYFFYAQYEGKQYKQCTSCQIGNIIGTTLISSIRLLILFMLNYFLVW